MVLMAFFDPSMYSPEVFQTGGGYPLSGMPSSGWFAPATALDGVSAEFTFSPIGKAVVTRSSVGLKKTFPIRGVKAWAGASVVSFLVPSVLSSWRGAVYAGASVLGDLKMGISAYFLTFSVPSADFASSCAGFSSQLAYFGKGSLSSITVMYLPYEALFGERRLPFSVAFAGRAKFLESRYFEGFVSFGASVETFYSSEDDLSYIVKNGIGLSFGGGLLREALASRLRFRDLKFSLGLSMRNAFPEYMGFGIGLIGEGISVDFGIRWAFQAGLLMFGLGGIYAL